MFDECPGGCFTKRRNQFDGLVAALKDQFSASGMHFDGFKEKGDEQGELAKTLGLMLWCIAGNCTEVVQSEYGFLASLRLHVQGSRDIVITGAPMMVNWASLNTKNRSGTVTMTEAKNRLKGMGIKDMQSFLSDSSHWIEHATVDAGDLLYIPAGALLASRSRAAHVVGLKVGLIVPHDPVAPHSLDSLGRWAKDWYKAAMTDHLANTFSLGYKVRRFSK